MTGSRSTRARIISNERLPEPSTIDARSSTTGPPIHGGWRRSLGGCAGVRKGPRPLSAEPAKVDDPSHPGLTRGPAENPRGLAVPRGEVLPAHRMDQVIGGVDPLERSGHGRGVERIARGDVGRERRPTAQRLGTPREAAHRHAAPLERGEKPSADVARGAGEEDAGGRHGTDTTRAEQGLSPTRL